MHTLLRSSKYKFSNSNTTKTTSSTNHNITFILKILQQLAQMQKHVDHNTNVNILETILKVLLFPEERAWIIHKGAEEIYFTIPLFAKYLSN